NPFKATTAIRYALPTAGPVHLAVYALNGQQVRTLVQGVANSGWHVARWDGLDDVGREVASGVYLYRLDATGGVRTGKMTLVR
ncbi:MAG: T9SS type A sorting domain-containing protein, partial [Gemmatimonadetes bacterium]|nr:T9SS type A sorting domain-containing protein [Gemmatimonadota bacterium]